MGFFARLLHQLLALGADALQNEVHLPHLKAAALPQGVLQQRQGFGEYIGDAAALGAVGVGVVDQRVVKAVAGTGDGHLEQPAVFAQQVEVAVDGAEAHLGVLRPHPGIDGIGGGVVIGMTHDIEDQFSLAGIFQRRSLLK